MAGTYSTVGTLVFFYLFISGTSYRGAPGYENEEAPIKIKVWKLEHK